MELFGSRADAWENTIDGLLEKSSDFFQDVNSENSLVGDVVIRQGYLVCPG